MQHLERLHCEAGADVARLSCWRMLDQVACG